METENIQSYEIPTSDAVGSMSLEQTDLALNKVNADWRADPKHPYVNKTHPQHADFSKHVHNLYKHKDTVTTVDTAPQSISELPFQQKRVMEATKINEQLVKDFGYVEGTIPDDINARDLKALREQLMAARENFGQLRNSIAGDVTRLKNADPFVNAAVEAFTGNPTVDTANEMVLQVRRAKAERNFVV